MLNSTAIGNKIAAARKKSNLSQTELAKEVFITAQAVGKWERGESLPDLPTLNRLATILKVDLNYFSDDFQSNMPAQAEQAQQSPSQNTETVKTGWNMSEGNWENADFSGLKNLQDKFSSSNLKACNFTGSDLSGLLLKRNNVDQCDFTGSNLNNCQLQSSNLANNSFNQASFHKATFGESNISDCDFTGSDFKAAEFNRCNLNKNTFTSATWQNTRFIGCALDELVFEGVIKDCVFEDCGLYRVTFQNATILNTFFKNRKSMKRLKFVNCKADRMSIEFLKSGKADVSDIEMLTNASS